MPKCPRHQQFNSQCRDCLNAWLEGLDKRHRIKEERRRRDMSDVLEPKVLCYDPWTVRIDNGHYP